MRFCFCLLSLLSFCGSAFAQQKIFIQANDTVVCLRVVGIATSKNEPLDGVEITLFKENEELIWEQITSIPYHDHSFMFDLHRNAQYSILISKEGFNSRLVSINTMLPDSVSKINAIYIFEFEVDLVKIKKVEDDFYLDFPVAIISYNKSSGVFENHDDYTKHIKQKMLLGIKSNSANQKKK
jgi:hypothetical protein